MFTKCFQYSRLIVPLLAVLHFNTVAAQLPSPPPPPVPPPPPPHHPKMHIALFELQAAYKELKESHERFGGHKARAILATNEAIVTFKLMLAVKGEFHIGERDTSFYNRHKNHPRLRQALEDLKA